MMLSTTHFGPILIDEASSIHFPEGLPGFEHCHRFISLQLQTAPGLIFLQSLECAHLCFLTAPMNALWPEYDLNLSTEDRESLGLAPDRSADELVLLAILSLEEGEAPTANLLAPLVIHSRTRRAVQAVRQDGRYDVREPLPAAEAVCL